MRMGPGFGDFVIRRRAAPLLALLALAVVLPASVRAAETEPADSLRTAEIAFARSVAERDRTAFAAAIAEEAIFIGPGGPVRGREAIVESWAPFFAEDGPRLEWHPEIAEVGDGGLGITRGPYTFTGRGPDGEPVTQEGTFNSIWRRQEDGSWRVIFDAGCSPCPKCAGGENASP